MPPFPLNRFRHLLRPNLRHFSELSFDLSSAEPRLSTGFELEFLGTSSAASTLTRNVSSLALHYGGGTLLFDCGEGTVRQFIKSHVKPSSIHAVFLTHLHGDHIYGIPGLGMRTADLREINKKIKLFAPRGLHRILGNTLIHNSQFEVYEIVHHSKSMKELPEESLFPRIMMDPKDGSYMLVDHPLFTVHAAPIKHSVFCLGYVIQEKPVRGNLLVEKLAKDHNLKPGPIFKEIIEKPEVKLPSGKTIKSADYMSETKRGRKIVILGDTCDPSNITKLAMDADVLVHEATCLDEEKSSALQHQHSTAGMAGAFAKKIRAKNLILTHFSPRNFQVSECIHLSKYISETSPFLVEECAHIQIITNQAKQAFGSPNVYAASDFWRFDVPKV